MDNNINWFPGHMAKALREIKERINMVDLVVELCDARAYKSSCNPLIHEIIGNKAYLKILNKKDLADDSVTDSILNELKKQNIEAISASATSKECLSYINSMVAKVSKPIIEKDLKRGLKPRLIRVMVLGIPNVGKSTFINLLAKRNSASVANKPGHTRAQQWIKCQNFELLDTPGVLYPNLKDNDAGEKLALIGTIKEEILPLMELCKYGLEFLNSNYKGLIENRYGLEYTNFNDFMLQFAKKKGHLLKDNEFDLERSARLILNEIKNGNIGKISLERMI